ncbi:hypothetical protein MIND_00209700 [Mycena indigotica]|uniref:F-box domain-containing protein n=1 Tax=Mycena indigotica TaxID=2126181 RepID=A0A8H6WGZ6_9AGAR|nr:uncharacterized protein MIND_00209700 [Mycena indigotica]KAF7311979.1 hypothetical protein MIND_00209700 [Mycena indigotica]
MGNIFTLPQPSVRDNLPAEILLEVAFKCSPVDIIHLEQTSKNLRNFIHQHKQYILKEAHKNLARGRCPPLPDCPIVQASGNFSHSAYANWVFGAAPCSVCSSITYSTPVNWALRLRACSKYCRTVLASKPAIYIDNSGELTKSAFGQWLPRSSSRPPYLYFREHIKRARLERDQVIAVLNGCQRQSTLEIPRRTWDQLQAEYAKREADRPILEKNAVELERWLPIYRVEKAVVEKRNLERVQLLAQVENVRAAEITSTPTMKHILFAFARDLAYITYSVWIDNRSRILAEIENRRQEKLACAFCHQLVNFKGFIYHMYRSHPKENRCPVEGCNKKQKVMNGEGLAAHFRAKHRAVPKLEQYRVDCFHDHDDMC